MHINYVPKYLPYTCWKHTIFRMPTQKQATSICVSYSREFKSFLIGAGA